MDTSSHSLAMPETIRTLLEQTVAQKYPLRGDNAYCYSFPAGLGLDDYVLRIRRSETFTHHLKNASCLTPPPQLLTGVHLGQPLLTLDGGDSHPALVAEICLRQPGTTVLGATYLLSHLERTDGRLDAIFAIAEKSGKNPLISLVEQAVRIHASGHAIDPNLGNIMIAPDWCSLQLIDQFDAFRKTVIAEDERHGEVMHRRPLDVSVMQDISREISARTSYECTRAYWRALGSVPPEIQSKIKRFNSMLDEAVQTVGQRYLGQHAVIPKPYHFEPMNKPALAFKVDGDSAPITVKAVALSDPPHRLVEQLRGLQRLALSENVARLP